MRFSKKRTFLGVVGLLIILIMTSMFVMTSCNKGKKKVLIVKIVNVEPLDLAAEGFKEELVKQGIYKENEIEIVSADGDANKITSFVTNFKVKGYDMALTVATPVAQAFAKDVKDKPVYFTAITDPKAAGLVSSNEKPGGNMTGTTDMPNLEKQIKVMFKIKPNLTKIGVIRSNSEPNSEMQVNAFKEKLNSFVKENGILMPEIIIKDFAETKDVKSTAIALKKENVDIIYTPCDSKVVSAMNNVTDMDTIGIPVFGSEIAHVNKGALITVGGIDYKELGRQTAKMAIKVKKGEAKTSEMAVQFLENDKMAINMKALKKYNGKNGLNIDLNDEIFKGIEKITAEQK